MWVGKASVWSMMIRRLTNDEFYGVASQNSKMKKSYSHHHHHLNFQQILLSSLLVTFVHTQTEWLPVLDSSDKMSKNEKSISSETHPQQTG